MCEIPDVKFENFAAAKACLQTTLTPSGAIVQRLSIQQDQNGKAAWRVVLTSTQTFPAPDPANFIAVRAVLNRYVPRRAVLRTINLEEDESPTHAWRWEVCYGIQRTSRIRRAVDKLVAAISEAAPCLKSTAATTQMTQHVKRLQDLEKTKERRRFFYSLRKSRSQLKRPSNELTSTTQSVTPSQARDRIVPANKVAEAQSVTPSRARDCNSTQGSEPVTPNQARGSAVKRACAKTSHEKGTTNRSPSYPNFRRGGIIPGSKPKTKTELQAYNNTAPDYDQWAIKSIVYEIKKIDVELLTSMRLIAKCTCRQGTFPSFQDHVVYAHAISVVKAASERINGQNINAVYLELLQRSGITDDFVSTFRMSDRIVERLVLHPHPQTQYIHIMCH